MNVVNKIAMHKNETKYQTHSNNSKSSLNNKENFLIFSEVGSRH